jgi:Na+/H+ antiporter NhaD/arsenite permease-like protein
MLPMTLPDFALSAVLFLIAFRLLLRLRIAIWQVMGAGALIVLAGGSISPIEAWHAIDWNVIGFLFGMFVLGHALVECGLLHRASALVLGRIKSVDALVAAVLLISGATSALLLNDTVAVIGTPLMLSLARAHKLPPTLLLLALAFGVTIGSVPSPIGNPQNLIIAIHSDMSDPFWTFASRLALPTLINLMLAWLVLRIFFWRAFHGEALLHEPFEIRDRKLARAAMLGLAGMAFCIGAKVFISMRGMELPLWVIAAVACAPVLAARRTARGIDWHTLIFFVALFVLMKAVWTGGALGRHLMSSASLTSAGQVLFISAALSQLVSNVPLVALMHPLVHGTHMLLALAAGSTIAGNLTLIGAASNVIIAQLSEKEGVHLGFWKFLAAGAPLALLNLLVYWYFLQGRV